MGLKIKYKDGYACQLFEKYQVRIEIKPDQDIVTPYIELTTDGRLTINKGYAWDGPTFVYKLKRILKRFIKKMLRGSLIHDALYQLMREEKLSRGYKHKANLELHRACREDRLPRPLAWLVLKSMKFTGFATSPKNRKKILTAP
jgi:hypothetical protein